MPQALSFLLPVVLGLLLHSCAGADYFLFVDPVNGVDSEACITETGSTITIRPTASCNSISYALSTLTSSDFLREFILLPGVYTGTKNTNIRLSVITSYWAAYSNTSLRAVIDCNYQATALTIERVANNQGYDFANIEFRNCVGTTGGAVSVLDGVIQTTFTNCTFTNNHASQSGGAIQGSGSNARLAIDYCSFKNNSAATQGGAIAVQSQTLSVGNSVFEINYAGDTGGAIYGNNLGNTGGVLLFQNNRFTNNLAARMGGAFFAESTTSRNYSFLGSTIDNNCATDTYTDSYDVQVRCASSQGVCAISNKGNSSGCTSTYVPPSASSSDDEKGSDKDRAIIIGVVVPFGVIAIVAIALFFYLRKRHTKEMTKRDDYRKKILKALDNMAPEDQEAARLEAEQAGPKAPKCQLCQDRPIVTPLPCGHEIVCSVCRTILLECPVKGCKHPTR